MEKRIVMRTARRASQCAIKGVNTTSLAGMRDSSGGSERSGLKTRTRGANSAESGDAQIKRLWYEPETLATDSEARTVANASGVGSAPNVLRKACQTYWRRSSTKHK